MDTTTNDLLRWLEAHFGGDEGVVDWPHGRRWTFAQLGDACRRVAAAYADLGLRAGDRVGWLALGSRSDLVALAGGARKLGAIPVVMNARASAERMGWMLDNAGVAALAYGAECVDLAEAVRRAPCSSPRRFIALDADARLDGDPLLEELHGAFVGAGEPRFEASADDVCLLAYTSGTTGRPKPVVHLEAEWTWTSTVMAYVLGLHHGDVSLVAMPPNFIGWAHITWGSLRVGAKQCCFRFDPATFGDVVAAERGTHALLTPTLIRMIRSHSRDGGERSSAPTLRTAIIGGEPTTPDVEAMLDEMFPGLVRISAVGATEGILLYKRAANAANAANAAPGAVGRPVPGLVAELRNEEDEDRPVTGPDRRGVLWARGPGIAAGIWNDPEATAAAFPGGWWRTGDVFMRDACGDFIFAGRTDHMFKSGAIKIYAEEVETALKRHPDVLDAVVVPVADETFGLVPFAHVRSARTLEGQELEAWWLGQGLERYSRPRHWRFWGGDPFPMVTPAKVDRHRLAQDAAAALGGVR